MTVLIETMRREGFELEIGPPSVIMKEEKGKKLEPVERVEILVPQEYMGSVVDMLNTRKGTLLSMGVESSDDDGMTSVTYLVPTLGMIGMRSALMTATRGTAIIDSVFDSYQPFSGGSFSKDKGSLLATSLGVVTTFGSLGAQERGELFVSAGEDVYEGMIVGVNQRPKDLPVNVCKTKALNNMRTKLKDDTVAIAPPIELGLDAAVEYISADEILEVTPTKIRMAKNPLLDAKRIKKKMFKS